MPDALTTATFTTPAGAGAAAAPRSPSTGRSPATSSAEVSVILLVRDGAPRLTECLDAIGRQTVRPRRLLVVDLGSVDTSVAIVRAHQRIRQAVLDVDILELPSDTPVGRAIDRAVRSLPNAPTGTRQMVWVLHADAAPEQEALARLVDAMLRSTSVGIAGPKLVEWDDPRRLVELGIQVTRSGRRIASPVRGEADQGQHDGRTDVLAVSTQGMLVDRAVHADLGGFDESFEQYAAGLDLGWRAQLAGHRVVVVPGAVVRDGATTAAGERPGEPSAVALRRTRRATRQVALARSSPAAAPFLGVWVALSSLVAALVLLVAKRPRQAWRELSDIGALAQPSVVGGARARGRLTKRLRRDDLATLFVTPHEAARTTLDHIQDAITPEGRRRRDAAPALETGPVGEESESLDVLPASLPRRIVAHPGFLAVLVVLVATVVAWRDPIRAGALSPTHSGLAGGELFPVSTGSAGLWHAFRDAWHGSGLGSGGAASPALAVLGGVTWLVEHLPGVADSRSPAGVTVAWIAFLGPALATWSAYLAGRVVTSSRAGRAVVAATWGLSAVATAAVVQGRLGAVVVHVVLPFVLAGFALAARRDGTYTAAFATALATMVVGAFAPPLLVLSAVAALLLVLFAPGHGRLRGLVLLVVPTALLGPAVVRYVDDWRLLLSGPGLLDTGASTPALAITLTHPDSALGPWVWMTAPLVVLGTIGYAAHARSRAGSTGLWSGVALAVVGLALALGTQRVTLGTAATGVGTSAPAHLWEGVGLQLWLAGLLVGLLAGSRAVVASFRHPLRRGRLTLGLAATVLALVPLVASAVGWGLTGVGARLTAARATLPAVAVEQAGGPLSTRLLLLRPSATVADFELVGAEPGELLRDLDRPRPDNSSLVAAVASLVGGRQSGESPAEALAALAVSFVQVTSDGSDELVRRLDSTEGLSRLGRDDDATLWKVQPLPAAAGAQAPAAPSRVRLVDPSGGLLAAVPTVGPHAAVDDDIPAGTAARRLVVAEPTEWSDHVTVTLDDTVLSPLRGTSQPTYVVPAGGGHLVIDLAAAHPWWRLGQMGLLVLVCFLALPFGNRRSRRPS